MKVTFLGTGTSQGVPVIACTCAVCCSADPRDKRLRTSVMVQEHGTSIVIDSGPDFRQQMLRAQVKHLDALLFTHSHKDHTAGMDDVRAFNYFSKKVMDVYASVFTQTALKREFQYIFDDTDYPGIPKIELHTIEAGKTFHIGALTITPLEVLHYKMPVLGFRINNFTYITDANHIPLHTKKLIMGSQIMVLNALRREAHISHFTLSEAIQEASALNIPLTYLTHISHQMGMHESVSAELPPFVRLAYDGLTIEI